jgi:anhydro-N-acetylmuramic acid kinase
MNRLRRIIIGLNSGTSADGVDAAACEITGRGLDMRVSVLGLVRRPYPADLRRRLLAVMAPAAATTEELCLLDRDVGLLFARTAEDAVNQLGLRRVDLIGSHGQTICHLPPNAGPEVAPARRRRSSRVMAVGATMQIGEPALIAARLGVPVVGRFRQADIAVGGQGAPLVPWTDYVLFRHAKQNRVVQNIGGIANLTWLAASGKAEDVVGFDTGPGNMLMDALVSRFTSGRRRFDLDGRLAAKGAVDSTVLKRLMGHPFLARRPPKSCGREEFGERWLKHLIERSVRRPLATEDWLATATAFTAASITLAYILLADLCRRPFPPMDEIILCGGGANNATLVRDLRVLASMRSRSGELRITTTADYGIPLQAKECVSFAVLAAACIDGIPANLPRVTGARERVVLGQVCNAGGRP